MEFNPSALLQEAEKHLGPGHGHAASISKLAEGSFNRVFLLTMNDGFEAIVKIPYHLSGPNITSPLAKLPLYNICIPKAFLCPKCMDILLQRVIPPVRNISSWRRLQVWA